MAMFAKTIFKISGNCCNYTCVRTYPRWNHRVPKRVILPHEYNEMNNKNLINNNKTQNKTQSDDLEERIVAKDFNSVEYNAEKRKEIDYKAKVEQENKIKLLNAHKKVSPVKKISADMLETVIDKDGKLNFTKLKDNDNKIGAILVNIKSKHFKDKSDLIVLEGKRIIKEALLNKCQLKYLVFSRLDEIDFLVPFLPKFGAKIYKMPYKEMQLWSDLSTCPGIMGFFKTPNTENIEPPKNHLPLTIICDNIREPGNLGAIIRCSAALPCEKIILTNGCVNLWDSKVTRSSSGSHFSIPILKKMEWTSIHKIIPENSNIYIADNKMVSSNQNINMELTHVIKSLPLIPYYGVNFNKNMHNVIIIGGETEGISQDSYKFAQYFNGVRINIPINKNIDSLNTGTALGIIMFEFKRQLFKEQAKKINQLEQHC